MNYPKLMISTYNGIVILFEKEKHGVVVSNGGGWSESIGTYSKTWHPGSFIDFNEEIRISNKSLNKGGNGYPKLVTEDRGRVILMTRNQVGTVISDETQHSNCTIKLGQIYEGWNCVYDFNKTLILKNSD